MLVLRQTAPRKPNAQSQTQTPLDREKSLLEGGHIRLVWQNSKLFFLVQQHLPTGQPRSSAIIVIEVVG